MVVMHKCSDCENSNLRMIARITGGMDGTLKWPARIAAADDGP